MQSQGLTRPRTWENSGIAIEFQCLLYFGCYLNEYMPNIPNINPNKRKHFSLKVDAINSMGAPLPKYQHG